MADDNAVELIKRGDKRFAARQTLDSFRQEVALNFSPIDASWTESIQWGEDYLSHLVDSTPVLLARDYDSQIRAMLRPPGKQWFWRRTGEEELDEDVTARQYLDWRSRQTLKALMNRKTGAMGALKRADRFYGLYGDAVISVDANMELNELQIQSYHTKDCAWAVGDGNTVTVLTRKEEPNARTMMARYDHKNIHPDIKRAYDIDPDGTHEIRHEVMPIEEYDGYTKPPKAVDGVERKFASVWVDVTNKQILRESYVPTFRYVVPRAIADDSMPYGVSMATIVALPDARLMQQQAIAILEAAERQVDPPLIAMDGDAIRGDINLSRGGITWIDRGYDDRTGAPIVPLELGKNFNLGVDSLLRTEQQLTKAFYLDVLRMPDTRSTRSVEEVQFRIDEYVRAALPLFAPMQSEYNEALLFEVDKILEFIGVFDPEDMPEALRDREDVTYQWDNPLADMMERQKAQTLGEISQIGQAVAALEAAAQQAPALKQLDTAKAFREAVIGIGGSRNLLSEEDAAEAQEAIAAENEQQQMMEAAPNIASVIDSGVSAGAAAQQITDGPGLPMLPAPI